MSANKPDEEADEAEDSEAGKSSDNSDTASERLRGAISDNSKDSSVDEDGVGSKRDSAAAICSSQAFGGARPKTNRASFHDIRGRNRQDRIRYSDRNGDIKSSDEQSVLDIQLNTNCDGHLCNDGYLPNLSRLESRLLPTTSEQSSKRSSIPDTSDTEGLAEDDCYIYTYKGGTAYLSADLPNSFFRLDSGSDGESLPGVSGAGQSNLSTGVAALIQDQLLNGPQRQNYSPDEDYIEEDYDPSSGSESESSRDSGQSSNMTDVEDGQEQELGDDQEREHLSRQEVDIQERGENLSRAGQNHDRSPERMGHDVLPILLDPHLHFMPNNNNEVSKTSDPCTDCNQEERLLIHSPPPPIVTSPVPPSVLRLQEISVQQSSSAPVQSPADDTTVVVMPRSKSLNSSLGTQQDCLIKSNDPPIRIADLSLCGSRLLQREALIFGSEGEEVLSSEDPELSKALFRLCPDSVLPNNSQSHKAMIWTEKEAIRKQVTQIGNSACGATALVNVALALDLDQKYLLPLTEAVHTRQRRPDSNLSDYLLSRSEAGCHHGDFIKAVDIVLPGKIISRFFPMHNRNVQLSSWLASWISIGCVPILTLNVQRALPSWPVTVVADAWHHQMVWGVSGSDIYLSNPLEMVQEAHLVPQLCSPSQLLVRRADILSRFDMDTDLSEINNLKGEVDTKLWQELNVLGQVANVIREERRASMTGDENTTLTSHIKIPACYTSGVTFFCLSDNETTVIRLKTAPDLPPIIS